MVEIEIGVLRGQCLDIKRHRKLVRWRPRKLGRAVCNDLFVPRSREGLSR
jgi:hypothetical protein